MVSTIRRRIALLAKRSPEMAFISLAHHMDLDWLREAFRLTRKSGATGVDGQTAEQYAEHLEENLTALWRRLKSGNYRAPPVRRVYIPKGDSGETRPIGIPTLEDKIVQRAVVMLLEPIYEQDFHPNSFGFRKGRGAHTALEVIWKQLTDTGGGWVLDVDLRKFFDTVDHASLREFLSRRVRDGALVRLIGKWLKAGVMEDGHISYPDSGTPQGGVISPLLANIFLHYVLDDWLEREVRPRLKGRISFVRYADDFLIVFTNEEDAHRVQAVLPKRFARFSLTVHPEKTHLVRFRHPQRDRESNAPGQFTFLGFTHYWGKSRKGYWTVKRKTASDRLRRATRTVSQWCRTHRHVPIDQQHRTLCRKLRGHYAYYGITGNFAINLFQQHVREVWYKWLKRRHRKRTLTWDRYEKLLGRFPLPQPRVVHSVYT